MKLQLALDRLSWEQCFQVVQQVEDDIDWIEVGTGVIKEYGMDIVCKMKEQYPQKVLVADMKTCDAGKHEAQQAFEAGADITTVMAFSADQTIVDTLEVAKRNQKRIMIDLLGIKDSKRIEELERLGADLVSLHIGKDMQKEKGFDTSHFALVRPFPHMEVTVAGGISLDTLPALVQERPHVLIVGSAITGASDPKAVSSSMKKHIIQFTLG